MPPPVAEATHPAHTVPAELACEHRAKPIPPVAHRFVANVDAALEQQVLNVPQRQWEAHVNHHHQADYLG
jgi:hypothetical protein